MNGNHDFLILGTYCKIAFSEEGAFISLDTLDERAAEYRVRLLTR